MNDKTLQQIVNKIDSKHKYYYQLEDITNAKLLIAVYDDKQCADNPSIYPITNIYINLQNKSWKLIILDAETFMDFNVIDNQVLNDLDLWKALALHVINYYK